MEKEAGADGDGDDSTHTIPPGATKMSLSPSESNRAGNDLSLRAVEPVNVCVSNLTVDVDISPSVFSSLDFLPKRRKSGHPEAQLKTILNDVSAEMPSGSLTAIIGGSGSGKTSLLNLMSNRMGGSRLKKSGKTLYNSSPKLSSIRSAYVMQQDVLLPTLTVRETLQYAADLRLPPPTTAAERRKVVEEVILELGLKECANTRIGNDVHKGCSGGEKRRTSLGIQLLSNPSVLFLDEVTTGLDATSAFQLIRTLKDLVTKGRTIITTIHQPRSEIWGLFDNLILLTGGSPVYSGSVEESLLYFAELGYPLPPFVNPAEHLIDLAAVDTRSPELEESSLVRVDGLKTAWRLYSQKTSSLSFEEKKSSNDTPHIKEPTHLNSGFIRQVRVLTARTFKITRRDPLGVAGSLIEAITMAIITGLIFLQLDESLSGIRSREGALYTAAALQGYLILLFETYRLTLDIELFDRERREGVHGVLSWIVSRRLARLFMEDIPVPLIFSVIFYFMVGFRPLFSQFFTFFAVTLLSQYIAVSFALLCVAVSRDFGTASLIANLGYTIQSVCCGYFVQTDQIMVWLRWLRYTAYVFYGFGALCANEFIGHSSGPLGQVYNCPAPDGADTPACKEYTGVYVMESLGFPRNWIWRPIVVLVVFVLAFSLGAALILKYWKVEMSISRARVTDTDYSAGKEKMTARSIEEVRTVDIVLDKYSLNIQKRNPLGRKSTLLSIVQPVSAKFQPGVLNVIMGPSGSGKTSLLNQLAGRLHSTYTTEYQPSGSMLINGAIPSEAVVRSIFSYVCQDDDALLPSLTVRETLRFAAGLRLPTWMSKEEKQQRAESVLLKMGLRDCADNLIGGELVKGISGGEKRRVTIGIQILSDPRVLLLDEPTSGLDAFTASSIIDVLKGLADEGRTLILTIHQSRSDLFKHFGNVLLLARGGAPVYAGKGADMIPHFSALGFECPPATNPADFALDLISVDLRNEGREATSRQKVRSLIKSWNETSPPVYRTASHIATPAELGSMKRSQTPFRIAFPLLVHRALINFRRQPPLLIARIMQGKSDFLIHFQSPYLTKSKSPMLMFRFPVVGFGIVLTIFFAPLKNDYYAVQTRSGYVQEIAAIYFVGMLQNVAIYP